MKQDSLFSKTFWVVEADSFAQLALWREYAREARDHQVSLGRPTCPAVEWGEYREGQSVCVGSFHRRLVWISCTWAELDGFLVMFYYACSELVDRKLIDNWLLNHCNPQYAGRRAYCDADNFHLCLTAIDRTKVTETGL